MAYLRAEVTGCMLSYSIAIPATISTAIMNMASLTSTATKEFTENTCNAMKASAQQQQRQALTRSGEGGARNK
jgi:hypothetical protein